MEPDETRSRATSGSSFTSSPIGPLTSGALFAGRYRIVELLGRGGMGEVYRAHDTMLDVAVALKRVDRAQAADQAQVAREVRLARLVTHRAVCRVYDVGVVDGESYITMEYVDGEDLGSLLRRVGRLPSMKVLEVARQACAGLAAAHAHGVLHRDLKPANIMIDRRGDVRITDFGIAVLQGSEGERTVAGTPAYMAPEQLRGQAATAQSDLYALGLVLYELLTGRPAFGADVRGERDVVAPAAPSALVAGVDSTLEQAILHALQPRALDRPESAVAFLAALTGGDVLQAVLDAGQTPSPQLVAASGSSGRLSPTAAGALWFTGVVALLAIVATSSIRLIDRVPLTDEPAVLADRARTFLRDVTGTPRPAHTLTDLQTETLYLEQRRLGRGDVDPERLVRVIYREGPEPIAASPTLDEPTDFAISLDNPPMSLPGMAAVVLDARGRLLDYRFVPTEAQLQGERAVDWAPFFRFAGLSQTSPASSAGRGTPPPYGPSREAWAGRLEGTGEPVWIDAASMGGVQTFFRVRREATMPTLETRRLAETVVLTVVVLAIVAAGLWLAYYNLGRNGDLQGALRLAAILFACNIASWMLSRSYSSLEVELSRVVMAGSLLLVASLVVAPFYLALEPFVRKRWPSSLVSWSRLIRGQIVDAQVGRDILIGAVASLVGTAIYQALLSSGLGLRQTSPDVPVRAFLGSRYLLALFIDLVPRSLTGGMVLVFIYSLLVMGLRRTWVAVVAFQVILTMIIAAQERPSGFEFVVLAIAVGLFAVVFVKFGLLALVAYQVYDRALGSFPLALSGDWRAEIALVTIALAFTGLCASAFLAARQAVPARA
ncbi:MAG: serine/threonine-protein kinase [Vicinamibacterales bacterium]